MSITPSRTLVNTMAKRKGITKDSKNSSSGSRGRPGKILDRAGEEAVDPALRSYEDKILFPSEGQSILGGFVYAKVNGSIYSLCAGY